MIGASIVKGLLCSAVLTSMAALASAQTAQAPVAGWQDGFFLQSPDGDYRIVMGLMAQMDGRFSVDDPSTITNSFALRKFRPTITGRLGRYFDFKAMPDLAGGSSSVQDAYLDVRFATGFRIRMGKDKVPLGYELLIADGSVLFPERSLASSLVPNRDLGVQAQGEFGGMVTYAMGVFNGIQDGASNTSDADTNNGKDVAGRVVVQPFRGTAQLGLLRGLGVHVGASTGRQEGGALPTFKTSIGQTFFSYASDVVADGRRTRFTPAVFYYQGAVGVFAEAVRSTQDLLQSGSVTANRLTNTGWHLTGSYVVTGENTSERGVRPAANFDPSRGQWGALQVLMRYGSLEIDPETFSLGYQSSTASRAARAVSVGVNWYPNSFIKYYLAFERTAFTHNSTTNRPAEHALHMRAQLGF